MGMGNQRHAPAALPPGKTRYPLYRRLSGPQGRSGRVRKISPPPGFDPHVHVNYLNLIFYRQLALASAVTCASRVLATPYIHMILVSGGFAHFSYRSVIQ